MILPKVFWEILLTTFFVLILSACGSDSNPKTTAAPAPTTNTQTPVAQNQGDADSLPPTNDADLQIWLATGVYKNWACESESHAARPGSAHSANRICINEKLKATTSGQFPVGAAAVKELFDANKNLVGYAVSRRVKEGTDGGSWYWYEKVGQSVYADGTGDSGRPKSTCVGCHQGLPNGPEVRDFVFTGRVSAVQ